MDLINQKFGLKLLTKQDSKIYYWAVLQLIIAGIIWGLSFTCVKWGLIDFTTTQLLFWRFAISFFLGEILFLLFFKELWRSSHKDILLSFKPGFFLGLSLLFQIHGLHFTTATNSGFITSLYVVIIPFFSAFLFRKKILYFDYILALLGFIGMGFLLDLKNLEINKGDLLTLGAAFTAAFQIIYIGETAKESKNAFRYNTYQSFWCFILLIPFFIYESAVLEKGFWPTNPQLISIMGLLCLAIFVSMIAFYLQVSAQKVLNTTTASMLCLLEGPFSFFFAFLLLQERLSWVQAFGATLILLSSALAIYIDRPQNRSRQDKSTH